MTANAFTSEARGRGRSRHGVWLVVLAILGLSAVPAMAQLTTRTIRGMVTASRNRGLILQYIHSMRFCVDRA